MLRGSLDRRLGDPDWDLRRIEPYCGYETYDFNVVVPPFDDRWGWQSRQGHGHRRRLASLHGAHA